MPKPRYHPKGTPIKAYKAGALVYKELERRSGKDRRSAEAERRKTKHDRRLAQPSMYGYGHAWIRMRPFDEKKDAGRFPNDFLKEVRKIGEEHYNMCTRMNLYASRPPIRIRTIDGKIIALSYNAAIKKYFWGSVRRVGVGGRVDRRYGPNRRWAGTVVRKQKPKS